MRIVLDLVCSSCSAPTPDFYGSFETVLSGRVPSFAARPYSRPSSLTLISVHKSRLVYIYLIPWKSVFKPSSINIAMISANSTTLSTPFWKKIPCLYRPSRIFYCWKMLDCDTISTTFSTLFWKKKPFLQRPSRIFWKISVNPTAFSTLFWEKMPYLQWPSLFFLLLEDAWL